MLENHLSLFMYCGNVSAASEAVNFGRTLEAHLGYLSHVTTQVWTLHPSLAAGRDMYFWEKGKGECLSLVRFS